MPDETPAAPAAKPELLKTQSLAEDGPGAGGWVPGKLTPIFIAVFVGISTSLTPVLLMPEPKWNVILAACLGGAATSLGTYFGIRSAGPRQ